MIIATLLPSLLVAYCLVCYVIAAVHVGTTDREVRWEEWVGVVLAPVVVPLVLWYETRRGT